eukprot:NODE_10439_length_335_cov_20.234266_g9527_i0.p1 GENE.NODE_10439_length_335_cov_20.234266_g9527_i0~~NODE_10439_length_335_cov_20.234266_g9527_i0.p1  ORF type:complete len:50 (+),score=11.52 NODE_10439_length_335_cov_20.234266_g9527_i0:65-214(+)
MMSVSLVNDGPVTLTLESPRQDPKSAHQAQKKNEEGGNGSLTNTTSLPT